MTASPFRVSVITFLVAILVAGCATARVEEQDHSSFPKTDRER